MAAALGCRIAVVVMKAHVEESEETLLDAELRLDRLLGRTVLTLNNQRVGRLEEFRAEKRGTGLVVTECVIGAAGLLERLGVGVRLLFGLERQGFIAGWHQIDVSNPDHPRLTCPIEELRKV